jgi:hypothetical protein
MAITGVRTGGSPCRGDAEAFKAGMKRREETRWHHAPLASGSYFPPPGGLGEAIVHVADARGAAQVGVLGQALDEDLDRALGDQTMKFARDQDRPDAVRQGSPTLKIPLSERLVRRKDWSGGRGSWPNLWPHAKRRPAPSGNALKQLS